MHPILNRIFFTRDEDLYRWGRLSAVFLVLIGCILIGLCAFAYNLVQHRLGPQLQSNHDAEVKLIELVEDMELRAGLVAGEEADWKITKDLLDAIRALILGGLGVAIIIFVMAALYWRAYELAAAELKHWAESKKNQLDP